MRIARVAFLCCALLAAALLTYDLLTFWDRRDSAERTEYGKASDGAHQAALQLNKDLALAHASVLAVASDIGAGKVTGGRLPGRLRKALDDTPTLFGVGVAFVPRLENEQRHPESPNYQYRDDVPFDANSLFEVVSVPLRYRPAGEAGEATVTGRVFGDYHVDDVRALLHSLSLGRSGYAFLLGANGRVLAHPVDDYVRRKLTLFEVAAERADKQTEEVARAAAAGNRTVIDLASEATGQDGWAFVEPLPALDWSLVVVYAKQDIEVNTDQLRHKLMRAVLWLLLLLYALTALVARLHHGTTVATWAFVGWGSTLTLLAIVALCWVAQKYPATEGDRGAVTILDRASLDSLVERHRADARTRGAPEPHFVPAGLLVQSLQVTGSSTAFVTGFAWVRHDNVAHAGLAPGLLFPDLLNEEAPLGEPDFTRTGERNTVYGWNFRVSIWAPSTYSRYPFDRRTISLRMWHKDFTKNVLLVPDLQAYPFTNPSSRPGVAEGVAVAGWDLLSSRFRQQTGEHLTNFGVVAAGSRTSFPEFRFEMEVERFFLDAFVSNVIPLGVVVLLLFIIMLATAHKSGSVMDVLAACGAFFFTVIIAHVALRDDLATHEIVYFEQFYFIMYFIILFVALNGLLRSRPTPWRVVSWRNNLVPLLLYWPMVLGTSLLVTVAVFY